MASIQKSSFRKRGDPKNNPIKGTCASLYNSQLLVSSGIAPFDNVIGGGIPVGSLVLINEDEYGTYANSMLKYFLAEGVLCQHAVYICSEDVNPEKMVKDLPFPIDAETEDEIENAGDRKKMTIAWRYENLRSASSTMDKTKYFGHFYDLSEKMEDKFFKNIDITYWTEKTVSSGDSFEQTGYYQLLQSIQGKLEKNLYFSNQTNPERNIIRIGLHHMGSPLWKFDVNDAVNASYFFKFLLYLRALIRNAYATCTITIPYSQHRDFVDKCIHFADIAVLLQSFAGTKCENVTPYKDYHGIFVIQKLAPINCFVAYNPHSTNLAFKLRRKKFVIEEFSLPPELEDTIQREQSDSSVLNCSSFSSSKIDF